MNAMERKIDHVQSTVEHIRGICLSKQQLNESHCTDEDEDYFKRCSSSYLVINSHDNSQPGSREKVNPPIKSPEHHSGSVHTAVPQSPIFVHAQTSEPLMTLKEGVELQSSNLNNDPTKPDSYISDEDAEDDKEESEPFFSVLEEQISGNDVTEQSAARNYVNEELQQVDSVHDGEDIGNNSELGNPPGARAGNDEKESYELGHHQTEGSEPGNDLKKGSELMNKVIQGSGSVEDMTEGSRPGTDVFEGSGQDNDIVKGFESSGDELERSSSKNDLTDDSESQNDLTKIAKKVEQISEEVKEDQDDTSKAGRFNKAASKSTEVVNVSAVNFNLPDFVRRSESPLPVDVNRVGYDWCRSKEVDVSDDNRARYFTRMIKLDVEETGDVESTRPVNQARKSLLFSSPEYALVSYYDRSSSGVLVHSTSTRSSHSMSTRSSLKPQDGI